jgi:hypothetical protein
MLCIHYFKSLTCSFDFRREESIATLSEKLAFDNVTHAWSFIFATSALCCIGKHGPGLSNFCSPQLVVLTTLGLRKWRQRGEQCTTTQNLFMKLNSTQHSLYNGGLVALLVGKPSGQQEPCRSHRTPIFTSIILCFGIYTMIILNNTPFCHVSEHRHQ